MSNGYMDVHNRTVTCKAHTDRAPTAPAQLKKKTHREELQLSLSPRNQKNKSQTEKLQYSFHF